MAKKKENTPFHPSYVSKLIHWVESRKRPPALCYFLMWVFFAFLQIFPQFLESGQLITETLPVHFWLAGMFPLFLILISYLDSNTLKSIKNITAVLRIKGKELLDLEFRICNMPRNRIFLFSFSILVGILIVEQITTVYILVPLQEYPVSRFFFRFVYLLSWLIFGAYLYHTIYLLNLIRMIFRDYIDVDIYQVKLLYSLSNISALNAGSIALVVYGWNIVNPIVLTGDPLSLVIMGAILILAFVAFLYPLIDIHNRLSLAKDIALNQCSSREGNLISKLNSKVDNGDFSNLEGLRSGLDNLELEFSIIKRISTWPWEPETFRLLFSALLLPMVIWFTQYALETFIFAK